MRARPGDAGRAVVHDLDAGAELVVAVDTMVEGVHFPLRTAPADVGFKALAVNLSDLAAMGATPRAARVCLTRSEDGERGAVTWRAAFAEGLGELAQRFHMTVAYEAPIRGSTSVTVEVLGSVPRGMALRRAGAAPGDAILVTGTLGDAGLALADEGAALEAADRAYLQARLARPEPRVQAGLALRALASAAIDVSDGLAADLGHILAASGVGARIAVESLPLSPVLARAVAHARALELALAAGDDYELCFSVPETRVAEAERRLGVLRVPVSRIGSVTAGSGLEALGADGSACALPRGYVHFQ